MTLRSNPDAFKNCLLAATEPGNLPEVWAKIWRITCTEKPHPSSPARSSMKTQFCMFPESIPVWKWEGFTLAKECHRP